MAYPRSEAEQAANATRLLAEASKLEAEARTAAIDTKKAQTVLHGAELDLAKKQDEDEKRRSTDEFFHVYRFDGEVTGSSVKNCMSKLSEWHRLDAECDIELIFSSGGGSIFDGMELFDFITELSSRGHNITTGGVGMAASMAGILVQAGDTRYLSTECWLLIHRAAFMAIGQTFEVEDHVKLIQRIEKRIINIFVRRSDGKLTSQKIKRNWERKDWWLSSDECVDLGLIDEIRG